MGMEDQAGVEATPVGGASKQERTWAMLCHLLGLCGFIGIPLANIIGPLVMWLVKKDQSALVDREGKKALNFQISMAIYGFVAGMLIFVVIGFVLLPIVLIIWLIYTILAAVKTNNGVDFKYPLTIPFFK